MQGALHALKYVIKQVTLKKSSPNSKHKQRSPTKAPLQNIWKAKVIQAPKATHPLVFQPLTRRPQSLATQPVGSQCKGSGNWPNDLSLVSRAWAYWENDPNITIFLLFLKRSVNVTQKCILIHVISIVDLYSCIGTLEHRRESKQILSLRNLLWTRSSCFRCVETVRISIISIKNDSLKISNCSEK